jgi:glutaredoxin 2
MFLTQMNNPKIMPGKFKQLQFEQETWKRVLGFMMEENIHLKNRITEILKDKWDSSLLEDVENFQSHFIMEDEMISVLRNDIAELEKLLANAGAGNQKVLEEINDRLQQLRENILLAEAQFGKLKTEFNKYLSQISNVNDMNSQ